MAILKVIEVLANSNATKQTINQLNKTLFTENKITIIPNGIDIKSFDDLAYDKLYNSYNNDFILGNLGRMVFQKNQDFLLDIAVELKKRELNFKILIGGDGGLKKEMILKIKKLKLENDVILLGFINRPKDFMMSIDAFLLPSRWEGFGYVLAEAMLCEKPVVAFDISSNSQIIESGTNGFLTPFNNVSDFCDKIVYLYQEKDSRAKDLGEMGRLKIEKEFDSKLIQKKVMNYLLG